MRVEESPHMMSCKRRWLKAGLILLAYCALTLAMTYPLVLRVAAAIPGDGFDGWQNYWNLWWMKRALVDLGTSPYFTSYLDYPSGANLFFHTLNPFNGLLSLPVQLVGGLVLAYNSVVLFSFALAGYGAYLLARYVLRGASPRSAWPAWVAGIIFAMSPFHFAHLLGHMQVFSLEWIPFYVLYLLKTLGPSAVESRSNVQERATSAPATSSGGELGQANPGFAREKARGAVWLPEPPRRRSAGLAALFLVLAGLCDWYFVLYLALFTALYLVCLLLGRRLQRQALVALAGTGVAAGLALAPLWWPMVREAGQSAYMVPDPEHAVRLSADVMAFVTPNEMHPIWGEAARAWSERFTTTTSERMVFAGYVPLLLAVCAVAQAARGRYTRTALFWTVSLVIFALLSLGPVLHVGGQAVLGPGGAPVPMPYAWLVQLVPFMNISRSVSRLDAMVMLSLAILAGLGLASLVAWAGKRGKHASAALCLLVTGAICFEYLAVPYPMTPPDTPAFYETLARDSEDYAVLNLPMDWDRPNYLLYQTAHRKPLISAYTSRDNPLSLADKTPLLVDFRRLGQRHVVQGDPAQVGLSVLHALDVRYVVVDLYQMPDDAQRRQTLALVQQVFGSQPPVHEDERLIVYQVGDAAPAAPFVRLGNGWSAERAVDGAPVRTLVGPGELIVHSPAPREATLRMTLASPEASRVGIYSADTLLGGLDLTPGLPVEWAVPLPLKSGDNVLRLVVERAGGTLELRAVGL